MYYSRVGWTDGSLICSVLDFYWSTVDLKCVSFCSTASESGIHIHAYMCLVSQLCPTLCDPMDSSPLTSSVHGDFPGKNTGVGGHALLTYIHSYVVQSLGHVQLFVTPWTCDLHVQLFETPKQLGRLPCP